MCDHKELTIEEFDEIFERDVLYLKQHIPPDDIYMFAEQNIRQSMYFLKRWSMVENINAEFSTNEITRGYVTYLMNFMRARMQGDPIQVSFQTKKEGDGNSNTRDS